MTKAWTDHVVKGFGVSGRETLLRDRTKEGGLWSEVDTNPGNRRRYQSRCLNIIPKQRDTS